MAKTFSGKRLTLMILAVWLPLLLITAAIVKWGVMPAFNEKKVEQQEEQARVDQEEQKKAAERELADLMSKTTSQSQYQHEVVIYADDFSGYSILRSREMRNLLRQDGIKFTVFNDKADYMARISALKSGDAQMAAFPIDSLTRAGLELGEFPCSIVFLIDTTQGADAMVAYKEAVGSIQDLDDESTKIVYTDYSPSELVSEVTVASFSMPHLSEDWRVKVGGSEEAYKDLLSTSPSEKKAWVLWQPHVAMALENPDVHVLIDTSKMKDFVIDTLVVNRQFLAKNPEVVQKVLEAYARVAYSLSGEADMAELVYKDAGPGATDVQKHSESVSQGIKWINTLENLAYFGIQPSSSQDTLEDIIPKIVGVMVQTDMIERDPFSGNPSQIYYDGILRKMDAEDFHPGKKLNVLSGMGDLGIRDEVVRDTAALVALSPEQWGSLMPVGNFQVPPVRFPRNSAEITPNSRREIQELAQRLKDWPSYYVVAIGQSKGTGDAEIDELSTALATRRAEAVIDELVSQGVQRERFQAKAQLSTSDDWSGLNLLFTAGQLPY